MCKKAHQLALALGYGAAPLELQTLHSYLRGVVNSFCLI